jgi:hypothetical protein
MLKTTRCSRHYLAIKVSRGRFCQTTVAAVSVRRRSSGAQEADAEITCEKFGAHRAPLEGDRPWRFGEWSEPRVRR